MLKVWCFILVCYAVINSLEALDADKCKTTPPEKHCLIEHNVKDKWPHKVRYVFNWSTQNCFEIRWADHCPSVPSPPTSNNFGSMDECTNECGGWA